MIRHVAKINSVNNVIFYVNPEPCLSAVAWKAKEGTLNG
jgi:hypothetical protein